MYAKLLITMQLSHYPSKLGPGDIYQIIYLEPLDLAIEASLGVEGGGWENHFPSKKITRPTPKRARA